jgi:hypothetical protein
MCHQQRKSGHLNQSLRRRELTCQPCDTPIWKVELVGAQT